jgi:lipopolysaccharide export system permease protein
MLFDSSVRKELGRSFGATLVVLLTIVLTMMLIRTLGQAASGAVSPQHVVLLMGYTVLGYLPTILALSLFVATVSSLSRMYRDSEMAVWFASGVPLGRFLKPVLVWPWANQSIIELRTLYERRSDLSRVTPGQFQSSSDGRRVFFIERNTDEGRVGRNVFVLTRSDERESVTTANTGRIEIEGEDRYLVLDAGQQADHNQATGERRIAQFETYRLLIDERVRSQDTVLPPRARSSLSLWLDPQPRHLGELTWRLGLPLTAFNLLLLGVVLSATSPRRGTSWNLMAALLAFIVYYNLLNLSQAWVGTGRLTPLAALVSIHGGTAVLALALLRWRERGLAGWLPRPRTSRAKNAS